MFALLHIDILSLCIITYELTLVVIGTSYVWYQSLIDYTARYTLTPQYDVFYLLLRYDILRIIMCFLINKN
jgi:hypothetical protein